MLLLAACSDSVSTQSEPTASLPENSDVAVSSRGVTVQQASERIAPNFSTKESFPTLYNILADNDQFPFVEMLNIYALPALNLHAISDEAQLISLVQSRKNTMVALQKTLESIPTEALQSNISNIDKELRTIGIAVKKTGNIPVELQQISHFKELEKKLATDPFASYKAFIQAQANFQASAFPYRNMEAVKEMVVAGEKLMTEFPKSIHYKTIQTDFREALSSFVGIYEMIEGGYSSIRTKNPMIDRDIHISEMETHKAFVAENPSSIYHDIVEAIIASPSISHIDPANLYVIYASQVGSIEEARKMQFEGLNKGKQFLHILPYDAGTNQDAYLIIYRFFDDENQSLTVLDQMKKANPDDEIQYLNLSVNAGRLYQLGI